MKFEEERNGGIMTSQEIIVIDLGLELIDEISFSEGSLEDDVINNKFMCGCVINGYLCRCVNN